MPNGTPLRSDSASQAAPFCPADKQRGTHIIDNSDAAFNGLPDLTSGRTLADALALLDWVGGTCPETYGREWLAEFRDIGCIAQRVRSDKGAALEISFPCDAQLSERQTRANALVEHFKGIDGGRGAILDELAKSGSTYGFQHRTDTEARS